MTTLDQRILDFAMAGHSADAIATELGLSENEVKKALQNLAQDPGITLVGPKGDPGTPGAPGAPGLTNVASGVATVTGFGTVDTGLGEVVTAVVVGVAEPSTAAGDGFSASAVPSGTGSIDITVRDVAGTAQATNPADVHWFASKAS